MTACLLAGAAMFQSCLKDQDDKFDDSPSLRMQAMLDNAKATLTAAEYGWALDYYPDSYLQYGGYAYTIKFDGSHATVGAEMKPGEFHSSLYKLTDDSGPVLSFDSYNDLMHYFATPDSEHPHAYDGDFEFILLNVTDDLITLRGKRTGNTMYMRRLECPADEYLVDVVEMARDIFLPTVEGTLNGAALTGAISLENRYMTLSWGEGADQSAGEFFVPVPGGIRFLNPVDIAGESVSTLLYSHRELTFTNDETTASQIRLSYTVGPEYTLFEDFEGDYSLIYEDGAASLDITLVPDAANNCYYMKGLNPKYDVVVRYDRTLGCLNFTSQQIGTDMVGNDEVLIWFTGKQLGGKYSVNTECGVYAMKDLDNPGTYYFTPNTYPTVHANSFYICQIKSLLYEDALDGDSPSAWHVNGSPDIKKIVSIKKK
ncbi:MAG: DUF4302 domain-containing protein [Bacteroides sp.]|nr:DUF4302 domain-containing protein [Bacteroides sp.]